MDIVHRHCAGLDVHKESVVACVRIVGEDNKVTREVRTFGTTTAELLVLSSWLAEHGVTRVAMEATGVYWKPVWHILSDGEFGLVLANAAHIKNVPGRKTDVNDATWIADLLAHGLIRSSFVPEAPIQELRVLMRTRRQLIRERARHIQRLHKVLEDANIKLEAVISDLMGVSGRAMIQGLIDGESDPDKLAALAHRKLKASSAQLREALHGRVTAHHRFMLRLHLRQIDALDELMGDLDQEVGDHLAPFRSAIDQLNPIPGVAELSAIAIIGEIGIDMSIFATAGHLLSWGGLVPGNNESAGKRKSTRLRKSGNWLKTVMVQCAWAAVRTRGCYFQAQFYRLKARLGAKKAICAVAASLLTTIYHMLKDGTEYHDLGPDHFDLRSKQNRANRLLKQLKNLGFEVQVTPRPIAA